MQLGHAEQVIAQREEGGRGHVLVHLIIAVGMNIMHPICHGIVYVVREHDIAWLMWSDTVVRGEEKHAAKVFLRSYFRGSSHLIVLTQPKKPTETISGQLLRDFVSLNRDAACMTRAILPATMCSRSATGM